MDLKDYHKEELQILLIAIQNVNFVNTPTSYKILKAWKDRIRLALKDK